MYSLEQLIFILLRNKRNEGVEEALKELKIMFNGKRDTIESFSIKLKEIVRPLASVRITNYNMRPSRNQSLIGFQSKNELYPNVEFIFENIKKNIQVPENKKELVKIKYTSQGFNARVIEDILDFGIYL